MKFKDMAKQIIRSKGWFARLVDMNDESVSASTVFLIATSTVALLLLLVPLAGLITDIVYNHTITINMGDLAAYIGASAGVFTAGGVLKGWTNYSSYRFNKKPNTEDEPIDDEDEDEEIESYE